MFNRILVAVSVADELSEKAADHAFKLADLHNAELKILNIMERPTSMAMDVPAYSAHGVDPVAPAALSRDSLRELMERRRRFLTDLISARKSDKLVDQEVREGAPDDEIIDCAKEWDADLIVIGFHSRNLLERLLQPSTSQKVIRQAPCAVLIFPESDDD